MKIISLQQGTSDWLSWRRSGIGGSDISAVVGESPYKDAWDVFQDKMGLKEQYISAAMRRGTENEFFARQFFEEDMGLEFPAMCVQHETYPWCIASLDGYNATTNSILEIKVPQPENYKKMISADEIPQHYHFQVQWQMLASSAQSCYFVVFDPENEEYRMWVIEQSTTIQQRLLAASKAFWEDNVMQGIAPDTDFVPDYISLEGDELEALCEGYLKFHEMQRIAETELREIKRKIIEFSDGGNFKAYGLKATWTSSRSTYDTDAMKADGIDIDKYKKPAKTAGYYTISKEKP